MSTDTIESRPADSPVADVPVPGTEILSAPLTIEFDYTRSLGPVLSQFALALRDGRIIGGRSADGTVAVPPFEFDPRTGAPITDLVDVATTGTVTSWTWQTQPTAGQPLCDPFGWALIRLDGADTSLLHAVRVTRPDQLSTGMRVHAVWRAARTGRIDDIVCFEPGEESAPPTPPAPSTGGETIVPEGEAPGQVVITTPVALTIDHAASEAESWYLEGLKHGKLLGCRVAAPGKPDGHVYIPPRQTSPADGSPIIERVELPDTGIVTTFCIVNVPFLGQQITPPYVAASIVLDGADIGFLHLILDCPADEVRIGMRVQAVWRPEDEWEHSLRNISHFRPTGEPDADPETYR